MDVSRSYSHFFYIYPYYHCSIEQCHYCKKTLNFALKGVMAVHEWQCQKVQEEELLGRCLFSHSIPLKIFT